ncbi:MAG: formimidoylglutamate deiminase [Rhodobacteraceae bacterium]|nr:MAG: formimidoylglutamate deiminase [Paracoccaceae bacterium]
MQILTARTALLPDGWAQDVTLTIDAQGRIAAVARGEGRTPDAEILIPAPANLHSHTFQRAMAGLTERRGPDESDSFWTWRRLMFRFLDQLTPDDIEAIAAFAFAEMLEAGFARVAEFHYLHHAPGGAPYADRAETSARIAAAAARTGIGLTLLPVLYMQGGVDGRALSPGQVRFGSDIDGFAALMQGAGAALAGLPMDTNLGAAPHSLRAVTPEALAQVPGLTDGPLHMHLAEQVAEVDEVRAAYGARPVGWALANMDLGPRWCLIHCTQMTGAETRALAATGAIAGLCPETEASLGDGVFPAGDWFHAGGAMGLGTDSNIRITLAGEIRLLEYAQRLTTRRRAVLADGTRSTARAILDAALSGGARATAQPTGAIAAGNWADLIALDAGHPDLGGRSGDTILDAFAFARAEEAIAHVWSAGRHVVRDGRHVAGDAIAADYARVLARLTDRL